MKRILVCCSIVMSMVLSSLPSHADVIALDADSASTHGFNTWSAGFAFTLTEQITIDKLLLFDNNGDGFFFGDTIVNIYVDDGTTTLAAPTLTATFNGVAQSAFTGHTPSLGVWREVDIVDTVLLAGNYTIIAGIGFEQDEVGYNASPLTSTVTGFTYNGPRSSNAGTSTSLNPQTNEQGFMSAGIYGPSFTVVPVPAAAWLAAPLLGVLVLATRKRRAA